MYVYGVAWQYYNNDNNGMTAIALYYGNVMTAPTVVTMTAMAKMTAMTAMTAICMWYVAYNDMSIMTYLQLTASVVASVMTAMTAKIMTAILCNGNDNGVTAMKTMTYL